MLASSSPLLPAAPIATPRRLALACLATIYVIWGSTYLAMAIAVAELPPLLMASMRFVAAGAVMLLIAILRGARLPRASEWLRALPVGALLFLGGNGVVAIAEQSVSSGGAAVVCATMPLWVGVLGASGATPGERPSRREWLALALGFAGVVVLMGGPSLAGEPVHVGLILVAPVSWALGSILARRARTDGDPLVQPGMHLLCGGAALALVAALRGEQLPPDASARAYLALGYLCIFGSLVAFTAYAWLLRHTRAVVATSYAYVNPVVAVVLGAVVHGEPLGVSTVVANAMIVVAVMLVLRRPAR